MLNDAEWTRELLGLSVIAPVVRMNFSQKKEDCKHTADLEARGRKGASAGKRDKIQLETRGRLRISGGTHARPIPRECEWLGAVWRLTANTHGHTRKKSGGVRTRQQTQSGSCNEMFSGQNRCVPTGTDGAVC